MIPFQSRDLQITLRTAVQCSFALAARVCTSDIEELYSQVAKLGKSVSKRFRRRQLVAYGQS